MRYSHHDATCIYPQPPHALRHLHELADKSSFLFVQAGIDERNHEKYC